MSLRLQSNTAMEIYGTRFLPLLGSDDPLRWKVMRWAHELGAGTERRTHNLEKTTGSNIIRGEFGIIWKSQAKDVKGFVRNCGICLRFRKEKCRPPLGRTLFRVKPCVRGQGAQTQKLYPLIAVCLNTGSAHVEIMTGLQAKDIYLGVLRLQYRYNTKVKQIFSDRGSQLSAKILGRKRNFYQQSLRRLWGIYNNLGYSQEHSRAKDIHLEAPYQGGYLRCSGTTARSRG
jgi:hypothetical protein